MFRVVVVALTALSLSTAAAEAASRTKLVELRVEGDARTLDKGTWYAVRGQEVKRARRPSCEARPGTTRFRGASALTLLAGAQDFNRRLRPVRVRPTDFGPQVCQIGNLKSFGTFPDPNAGFLYYVNYESGFSSADLAKVASGDRVLWHYSVFPSDPPQPSDPPTANTGCALQLHDVPAHDADGTFQVEVTAHGFGCTSTAAGVTIVGAESSTPAGMGRYTVTVGSGRTELFAVRGQDVRSNRLGVCVDAASDCPTAHGRKIVGSARADRLPGTRGFDVIRGRSGDDRINLRRGGRDRANCGRGDDVVVLKPGDGNDRIRANCERIRRS